MSASETILEKQESQVLSPENHESPSEPTLPVRQAPGGIVASESLAKRLLQVVRSAPYQERGTRTYRHLPGGVGIPKGALVEVCGAAGGGKTEWVLRFLEEHASLRAVWVEHELTLYPPALEERGVGPERVVFVEAPERERWLWAALQALSSRLFDVAVLEVGGNLELSDTDLRRLQIEAGRSGATVFLLTEQARSGGAWPVALRLGVRWEGSQKGIFDCQIHKGKERLSWKGSA